MQQAKIAVIVLALGAAGLISWKWGSGNESVPEDVDTNTEWMCDACEQVFSLSAPEVYEAEAAAGGSVPLICRACSEREVYRVATCPDCGKKYFGAEVPGCSGACPQCNPDEPILIPKKQVRAPGAPDVPEEEEEEPPPPPPDRGPPVF